MQNQQQLYGAQNTTGPRYAHRDQQFDGTAFGPPAPGGNIPRPITSNYTAATENYMYTNLQREARAREDFLAAPAHRKSIAAQLPVPQLEDINAAYINESESSERATEPIYRTLRFNACSKYSGSPMQSQMLLQWPITANVAQANTIVVNDAYLQAIVSVALNPFYVPASMFSDSDFFYGYIQLRLDTFPTSELSCYDYFGSANQPQVALYHFDCSGVLDATTRRWLLTPTPSKINFAFPVPIANATWRVSFRSPISGINVPVPPSVATGFITGGNPMRIKQQNHGLSSGYYITIDNQTPIPNLSYTPYVGLYIVTYIDANNFSINLDGSAITGIPTINYGIATNNVRMHFEVTAIDKKADIVSSNRAVLIN